MPSTSDFVITFGIMGVFAVAAVGALTIGGEHAYKKFIAHDDSANVQLSPGRNQLLDQGMAGTRKDLNDFLARQTDEYFKQHQLPCDPGAAGKTVADTIAKAQHCDSQTFAPK